MALGPRQFECIYSSVKPVFCLPLGFSLTYDFGLHPTLLHSPRWLPRKGFDFPSSLRECFNVLATSQGYLMTGVAYYLCL